jgi:fluoroquinolone transport system permease protein
MTNRFASIVSLDFKMQARYGFLYAAAFTMLIFIVLLRQFDLRGESAFLPSFILFNLIIGTFYFVAGMLLFEKDQGVLQGLTVTPLRVWEYLGSKTLTLSALALVENFVIIFLTFGTGFNVLPLVAGTALMAAMYTLFGFVVAARYRSITEYLLPSVIYMVVLMLPIFDYLHIFSSPLFYLHPLQAPLLVMKSAVLPVGTWDLAYGVIYSLIWIGLAMWLSMKAFDRYIVNKTGGK